MPQDPQPLLHYFIRASLYGGYLGPVYMEIISSGLYSTFHPINQDGI